MSDTATRSSTEARLQRWKPGLDAIPPVEQTVEDGTLRITRRFRGLTLQQALGYLESLGGRRRDDTDVEGDGWHATLSATKVPVGPSFRLTEVTVTWTGEPEVVERIVLHFRLKAFRAPG
ncbi:MAG: hypothetical protein ABEI96_05805 [Haloarculaceae archaeon]